MSDVLAPRRPGPAPEPAPSGSLLSGLWRRQLPHYPDNGPRSVYLGIVVLATIVLYYELYIQGAVGTQIIADHGMTLERHDPAATATGLAVYEGTVRTVVTVSMLGCKLVVSAASTLVDPQLSSSLAPQLQTLSAVPPATLSALSADPRDTAAQTAAVTAIASTLSLPPAEAAARLASAAQVPVGDLQFLQTTGPAVQQAADQLTALGAVPPADLAYLQAEAHEQAVQRGMQSLGVA